MIDYYIHQNLIQWLSRSIEFNDLIRCKVEPEVADITGRYETDDKFYKHVEDIVYSSGESKTLYPFVGINFGPYDASVCDGCGVEINVFFQIIAKRCTPEECGFSGGGCSVPVGDPRKKINDIQCYLTKMFNFGKQDGNGIITRTNIFNELKCTNQQYYDCDTEENVEAPWKYNVFIEKNDDPIIGQIESRQDGAFVQNITVPLVVTKIADENLCSGDCGDCVCDFGFAI